MSTHTLGMIVPDIANPFFPSVVRGAEDAAQKCGYNLLLCNSDNTQEKEEIGLSLLVNGLLILGDPPQAPLTLYHLHAGVWWGALLTILGAIYCVHFAPGRNKRL